jgi:hypothetical protein
MTISYSDAAGSKNPFLVLDRPRRKAIFNRPLHTDGFMFGFLFRFVTAVLAILIGTVLVFIYDLPEQRFRRHGADTGLQETF